MSRPLLLGLTLCLPALAQASGTLDARFGGDGIVVQNLGGVDRFSTGLIDSQGRLVGAGTRLDGPETRGGILQRRSPGGAIDASFGDGGLVFVTPPDGFNTVVWADIVERPDGRLLAAGRVASTQSPIIRAYFCQFLPNGAPDPAFGSGGCAIPVFWVDSNLEYIVDLALQPDGLVVAVGTTEFNQDPTSWTVARYEEDGSPDLCFGDAGCQFGGVLIEPEPAADLPNFEAYTVAIAPDGRIVVAGSGGSPQIDMAAVRLLPTGSVDLGFGNGGHRKVAFDQGGFDIDRAKQAMVTPNGRTLLAGSVQTDTGELGGATALDVDGNVIASFGDGGRRILFFNDVSAKQFVTEARLQDDGKIVVAGYTGDVDSLGDCGVLRLDDQGDLDPVFGIDGKLNIDANLGADPTPLDDCPGLGMGGGAIALFGSSGAALGLRDTLMIKLEQHGVFRDGYEAQP